MIYDKVKEACKEEGISVAALEKKANLANGAISKWNDHTPFVTNLQAVADALGKPIGYFLEEEAAQK